MTDTTDARHRSILPRIRRALRLAGRNALLLFAGLALIGLAGEAWFRLTTPFTGKHFPGHFVPNVGLLGKPHTEVRWSNDLDYWTVSRTNKLGFLDREPIDPKRAAASCHVTMIGDSFVEAAEVAVTDKFHVRLEALAARELPHLDVTTSAFGRRGTGQIHQLPLYDEYARHLSPKLLVLVVYSGDFLDNSTLVYALRHGLDPERIPYVTAARDENGEIRLHPPHPDYMGSRHAGGSGLLESAARTLKVGWEKVHGTTLFGDWLYEKARIVFAQRSSSGQARIARAESLSRLPRYALLLEDGGGSQPLTVLKLKRLLRDSNSAGEDLPLVYRDALDMMVFALDQFKTRTDRDGVALAILTTHGLGEPGDGHFDWLTAMVEARGIPVINLYDYIIRRGGRKEDAQWPDDAHWNLAGHQWAAEALLEYLKQHPETCGGAAAGEVVSVEALGGVDLHTLRKNRSRRSRSKTMRMRSSRIDGERA